MSDNLNNMPGPYKQTSVGLSRVETSIPFLTRFLQLPSQTLRQWYASVSTPYLDTHQTSLLDASP